MNFSGRIWGVFGAAIVLVSGCAIFSSSSVKDTEAMLSAAGFQVKLADTPEKLEHLQSLDQHVLLTREKDGQVYYVYADAAGQQLFYGDEKAYQNYQIRRQQEKEDALDEELTEKEHDDAVLNAETSWDWGIWEPWGICED